MILLCFDCLQRMNRRKDGRPSTRWVWHVIISSLSDCKQMMWALKSQRWREIRRMTSVRLFIQISPVIHLPKGFTSVTNDGIVHVICNLRDKLWCRNNNNILCGRRGCHVLKTENTDTCSASHDRVCTWYQALWSITDSTDCLFFMFSSRVHWKIRPPPKPLCNLKTNTRPADSRDDNNKTTSVTWLCSWILNKRRAQVEKQRLICWVLHGDLFLL